MTFIGGDNDFSIPALRSIDLDLNGRKFLFIHGHQFNLASEAFTKKLVRVLKRINKRLPVVAYATYSRMKSKKRRYHIILGHSHALGYFPRLKVAASGCLTTAENVYNDRGYISIAASNNGGVQLCVNRFGGEREVFEL